MSVRDVDHHSGTETTGHEWDGVKELNTPLPRWWLIVFYVTIVWAFGYWVVYPAWPIFFGRGYTTGIAGYSSRADVAVEVDALRAQRAERAQGLTNASLEEIKADANLRQFAMALGKAVFGDNCAPCHGQGAQGSPGYPNLNDDNWIWGGKLADIQQTITHGIRFAADAETRTNLMPAFGRDQMLTRAQIDDVVSYILQLNKKPTVGGDPVKGAQVFADNCVACHGDNARGNPELGAPNLAIDNWLYGGDRRTLTETLLNGRGGVMPAWGQRLDNVTIKALTVYIHSLGGGQ